MKKKIYNLVFGATVFVAAISFATNDAHAQNISTVAGNNTLGAGYSGDGGAATAAKLYTPNGVAKDASGNIYVTDYSNNVVRKINTSGTISTFAGTGTSGYTGDGGTATAATLDGPWGVAVDATGNVYVADYNNYVIRKINTSGIISTYAGNGTGSYTGDGAAATAASIYRPTGICIDGTGNLYIADSWNHAIRKVTTAGVINTVAGNGTAGYSGDGAAATAAKLNYPYGVAITTSGKLYIADYLNYVVREVNTSTGNIATVAGNNTYGYSGDGSVPYLAQLSHPTAVAIDPTETKLYISDLDNNRVRVVTNPPNISTYAGIGTGGFAGDGGAANAAKIKQPSGLFCDASGNLFICDKLNYVVRKVVPAPIALTGPTSVCVGATITLTTTFTSVTWTSNNTAVATVDASGVVTGVAVGTATIYCTDGPGLGMVTVTVSASPAAITGTTTVCQGSTTTLSSATSGGTWTSLNTAVATAAATGDITGVAPGTSVIFYSVSGCGVTTILSVSPLPNAGTIAGANNVCEGATVALSNSATGGTWSSSAANATVSATGVVTGVTVGAVTISYTASNSCGTAYATIPFTVNTCPTGINTLITERNGQITIYPNPAISGQFTLSVTGNDNGRAQIVISNLTGEQVKTINTTTNVATEVKLNVPTGVYFITAETKDGRQQAKVVIQ